MSEKFGTTTLTNLISKIKTWTTATFFTRAESTAVSTISIDSTPTSSSANLVTSGGVYTAVGGKTSTSVIADAYDSTSTYSVGNYCMHDGTLYQCNTAISVAEEWTAAHWTEKQIVELESPTKIKFAGSAQTPDASGYVNIPYSGSWISGLISYRPQHGLVPSSGETFVRSYSYAEMQQRNDPDNFVSVYYHGGFTPKDFDSFVKLSLCDGTGVAWSDSDKQGAWSRFKSIKTSMDSVAVAGAEYYLGEQTAVSFTLPSNASTGQTVSVVFYSGSTAATLSVSGTTIGEVPTPAANQRIELNCLWDGTNWAILSNTMEVAV